MRLPELLRPTWQVNPQLERTLEGLGPSARIADVGAGGRRVRPDALCVDVAAGPGVDLVADAHALPLPDASFDLAICTGTLNLCRNPRQVLTELHRILAPGGLLHLEVGMFQPYNPEPEDYWRFTRAGLEAITGDAGFTRVRAGVHMGPFSAFSNNAVMLASKVAEGPGLPRRLVRGGTQVALFWLKYLDHLLPADVLDDAPFAYGLYFVGRKT